MTTPNASLEARFEECCELDASVNERLSRFAAISRELNPAYVALIDRLVERLQENRAGDAAPRPGEPMPSFCMPDENGNLVELDQLLEHGPVAVVFHRGHWCPYCRINTRSLAEAYPAVRKIGGEIVAIIPDRQKFALQLKESGRLPFKVLTDLDNGFAMSLNLAIWLGSELRDFFAQRGHNMPEYQGNESWVVPIPATFVVAPNGLIAERFVDPDYRRRMDIDALLAAMKACT